MFGCVFGCGVGVMFYDFECGVVVEFDGFYWCFGFLWFFSVVGCGCLGGKVYCLCDLLSDV